MIRGDRRAWDWPGPPGIRKQSTTQSPATVVVGLSRFVQRRSNSSVLCQDSFSPTHLPSETWRRRIVPDKLTVAAARNADAIGREVLLQGWVRTRRDSKAGFSFIELNDGSCFGNIQVIAPAELENYETEVKHLSSGSSVSVEGLVKESPGKGQATEVQASKVSLLGTADTETYPLQKKRHSFEFLRTIAHLRPRTNTFGAVARTRNNGSPAPVALRSERRLPAGHGGRPCRRNCRGN